MKIDQLMDQYPEKIELTEGYINMIESCLTLIKANSRLYNFTPKENQRAKYNGDFYGLLDDCGLSKEYHYATMRVNGLASSADYTGDNRILYAPDVKIMDLLKKIYITK
jgi:hypothetical protein